MLRARRNHFFFFLWLDDVLEYILHVDGIYSLAECLISFTERRIGLFFFRVLMINYQKFCSCSLRSRFILRVFTYSAITKACDLNEDCCYVVTITSDIAFPRLDYNKEIFSRLDYYWSPSFEEHCFSPEIAAFLFR